MGYQKYHRGPCANQNLTQWNQEWACEYQSVEGFFFFFFFFTVIVTCLLFVKVYVFFGKQVGSKIDKYYVHIKSLKLLTSTFASLKIRPCGLSKISPRTLRKSKSNSMKPKTSLRRPKPSSLNWISRKHLEKKVSPCYKSSWHKQVRYLMLRSESYCIVIQDGCYFYKRDYHSMRRFALF